MRLPCSPAPIRGVAYASVTWLQVSVDRTFPERSKRPLFGPNPKGIMIYTADGHFSLMQSRSDLPKLESSNRATAMPDEANAVVAGSIAYNGSYGVDEGSKIVSIDIQGSTGSPFDPPFFFWRNVRSVKVGSTSADRE
jgi:hypothetical protein